MQVCFVQDPELEDEIFRSAEVFKTDYAKMERELKIYVYPDGDSDTYYHTPRKLMGKYASEGYFFHNIKQSPFLTPHPNKAHLFFIPISCHKMRGKVCACLLLYSFLFFSLNVFHF